MIVFLFGRAHVLEIMFLLIRLQTQNSDEDYLIDVVHLRGVLHPRA